MSRQLSTRILCAGFVSFSILMTSVHAWSQTDLWQMKTNIEKSIEDKLKPAVALYDPDALISVHTQFKKQAYQLPGTPFTYHSLSVSGADSNLREVDVTIFTRRLPIPKSVESLMRSVIQEYTPNVRILVHRLPQSILPKTSETTAINKPTDSHHSFSLWLALAGSFILIVSVLIGNSILNRRHFRKVLEGLGMNLKDVMETAGPQKMQGAAFEETLSKKESATAIHSESKNQQIELGKEGLRALMWDCYWTHHDSYAAFVWNSISLQQRQNLFADSPSLIAYVRYLSQISEENLGLHNDPAYIMPLPIDHLDQKALTSWVQKHPQAIKSLSRLRAENLKLSAVERISMLMSSSASAEHKLDFSEMKTYPSSVLRKLEHQSLINLESIQEEREVLAMKSLTYSQRKAIASLGWLLELPAQEIQEILDGYSARELASAWIAPEEVLRSLEKAIAPKKAALIRDFLNTVNPSRHSPAYLSIHQETMGRLLQREQNSNIEPVARSAA